MYWSQRFLLLFFCGLPMTFLGVGGLTAWGQWHRLRSFAPAEAVVTVTDRRVIAGAQGRIN